MPGTPHLQKIALEELEHSHQSRSRPSRPGWRPEVYSNPHLNTPFNPPALNSHRTNHGETGLPYNIGLESSGVNNRSRARSALSSASTLAAYSSDFSSLSPFATRQLGQGHLPELPPFPTSSRPISIGHTSASIPSALSVRSGVYDSIPRQLSSRNANLRLAQRLFEESGEMQMMDESALDDTDIDSEEEERIQLEQSRERERQHRRNSLYLASNPPISVLGESSHGLDGLPSSFLSRSPPGRGSGRKSRRNSMSSMSDDLTGLTLGHSPNGNTGRVPPLSSRRYYTRLGPIPHPFTSKDDDSTTRYSHYYPLPLPRVIPTPTSTVAQPIPIPGARRQSSIARSQAQANIAHSPRRASFMSTLPSTLPDLPPLPLLSMDSGNTNNHESSNRMRRRGNTSNQAWPDVNDRIITTTASSSPFLPLSDDSGFVSVNHNSPERGRQMRRRGSSTISRG